MQFQLLAKDQTVQRYKEEIILKIVKCEAY